MGYDSDYDDDDSELVDEEELCAFAARHGLVEEDDDDEGDDEDEDDRLLQSVQEQVGNIFKVSNPQADGEVEQEDDDDDESLLQSVRETCGHAGENPSLGNKPAPEAEDEQAVDEELNELLFGGDEEIAQEADDNNSQLLRQALEKNRKCQELLRGILSRVEARKRENEELQKRVRALKSFEKFCKRRAYSVQGSDARFVALLASLSIRRKGQKKITGPEKNKDVDGFQKLHSSVRSVFKDWSPKESQALRDAVKTQVMKHLFLQAMEAAVESDEPDQNLELRDEISDAEVKNLIQVVNWEAIAKFSLPGRTPKECKARWLNHEDQLINHGPWSKAEDLQLLTIAKEKGFSNWEAVAESLGTYRTAAQCLMRYQRSLNANLGLREWSREDDEELRRAVEIYGEKDWETVAACLEGRTGPQVMGRWFVIRDSEKKKGRWSVEEDKRLQWAVLILGAKEWKKIAMHVPGRSDVQCRERWRNVLDPELVHGAWGEEEDERLEEAVERIGQHKWAAVAEVMKPRTDNQCWRRWMALHPEEKDQFHEEVVLKKTMLPVFGKRRKDRPDLEPSEILSVQNGGRGRKRSRVAPREEEGNLEAGNEENSLSLVEAGKRGRTKWGSGGGDGGGGGKRGRRRTVDVVVGVPGEPVGVEAAELAKRRRVARMEKMKGRRQQQESSSSRK